MGEREEVHTVPPRLSLSAGFTWIGLFICDRERKEEQIIEREENEKGEKKETKKPVSTCTHVTAHAPAPSSPQTCKKNK